ncbi:MAG: glycerate kinase [Burkholderiaceae bacterium]
MLPKDLLLETFRTAVAAADPRRVIDACVGPLAGAGARRVFVAGAGKAAAAMAAAFDAAWPAATPLEGLVVTRYGHGEQAGRIEVIEAGHPMPDEAGMAAAERMLDAASGLEPEDLLVVLLSGGGSSLLALPVSPLSLEGLRELTAALLASGAPIDEMNVVRRHVSRIQGGWLAASTRARVQALVISDVAGDDLAAIASGPCSPDPSTHADALEVLRRWRVDAPAAALEWLESGRRGEAPETPKPGDPRLARTAAKLVGSAHASLEAAARRLEAEGIASIVLGDTITGEARDVARVHAGIVRELLRDGERSFGERGRRPVALLSGGECTVTLRGQGRGGRNTEFLLALADALGPLPGVWAIAADTDGIDGVMDNAGAIIAPDTLPRSVAAGLDARARLDDNDAYGFFEALGDLVVTGPTRTNVNDFRLVLLQ